MSGSITVDNQHLSEIPVATWMTPKEKARAIAFTFSFPNTVSGSQYTLDLHQVYERGAFTTFQTIFIDNSASTSATSVTVDQTGQTIVAAPLSQGYYAVGAPMPCRVTFTNSNASAVVNVLLINVPVTNGVWGTTSSSTTVSDPILEAAVTPSSPATKNVSALQVAAVYNTTPPSLTNGQSDALQLTSSGQLQVNGTTTDTNIANVTKVIAPSTAAPDMLQIGGVYESAGVTLTNGQGAALQLTSAGAVEVSDVLLEATLVAVAPGTASSKAIAISGIYNSAGVTLTNGQAVQLQTNSLGYLKTSDGNLDASITTGTAATAPTDGLQILGQFVSGGVTLTTGQSVALQMNSKGMVLVTDPAQTVSTNGSVSFEMIGGQYVSAPTELTNGQTTELLVDSYGAVFVDTEGLQPLYIAGTIITPAATPTIIAVLPGSASKTIRLHSIEVSTVGNTGPQGIILQKQSSAPTGGTSTAIPAVGADSNNTAPSAAPLQYSANPTSGTAVGDPGIAYVNAGQPYKFTFGSQVNEQSIVLRGTAQVVAVVLNGAATGLTGVSVVFRWTEV